jgi:hypothetical protein
MRELTKSMMSFSWAMSLYGLRQMAGLFDVRDAGRGAAQSFEAVTRCTEDQLGAVTQSVFRAGDNLQRGVVDLMFNLMTMGTGSTGAGSSSPSSMNGVFRRGADAVQGSVQRGADLLQRTAQTGVDVLQRTAQAASAGAAAVTGTAAAAGNEGWGPVPPPGY